jgi:hypothetical protein
VYLLHCTWRCNILCSKHDIDMRMNEWNRHALFLSWNGRNRYLHPSLLKIWVTRSCLYGLSYIENASKRKKLCFSSWRRYFWITHLSRNCALPVKGDIMLLSVWGDFVFYLFKTLDYICLRRHKVYLFKEILFHIYLRRHKQV